MYLNTSAVSISTTMAVVNAEPDIYRDNTAVQIWLNSMGLSEYYDIFIKHGFGEQMASLLKLSEQELDNMGIRKLAHRKRILWQIQNNRNMVLNNDGSGYGVNINTNPQYDQMYENANVAHGFAKNTVEHHMVQPIRMYENGDTPMGYENYKEDNQG
eukprot:UN12974